MKSFLCFLLVFFVVVGLLVDGTEGKKKKRRHWLIPAPSPIIHCNSIPSIGVFFSIDGYRDRTKDEPAKYPTCKEKFELKKEVVNTGYSGVFCARIIYDSADKLAILAIQGTNPTSVMDWMNDFRFSLVACDTKFQDIKGKNYVGIEAGCGKGKLHDGFLKEWAFAKSGLMGDLKSLLTEQKPTRLLITGHSKGAAIAYIAALDIKGQLSTWGVKTELVVMTYGSPRPGDEEFSKFYASQSIPTSRYAITSDPVTMVPLAVMGYVHVGGDSGDGKLLKVIPLSCTWSNIRFFCHEGYQPVVDLEGPALAPLVRKKRSLRHI